MSWNLTRKVLFSAHDDDPLFAPGDCCVDMLPRLLLAVRNAVYHVLRLRTLIGNKTVTANLTFIKVRRIVFFSSDEMKKS